MISFYVRNMRAIAFVAAVICCFTVSNLVAASPAAAPNVIYTATGSFTEPPIKGNDLFQLQGQPYTITVTANEADSAKNNPHGPQWAEYKSLSISGQVTSGMLPTPITFSNKSTAILLACGNPSYDIIQIFTPVQVVGITIYVVASIHLPKGTLTNDHILPFTAPVTLTPAIATMTYSDPATGTSTTLGMTGTANAVVSGQ